MRSGSGFPAGPTRAGRAALLAAAVWLAVLPSLVGAAEPPEVARVAKVFDGDTILLEDGRKVRYLGINSPEYQEPFYLKAKRFNERLVLGREVRLELDEERVDGHDRLLAYVYVGDELVNAKLVQAGLAHAFFIGPSRKHHDLFLRLQAEARRARVGLWSVRTGVKALKITNLRLADGEKPDPHAPYVRIANLSEASLDLAGYVLANERGDRFVFPRIVLEPGRTVVVSSGGARTEHQAAVLWAEQPTVWDSREDTAFLFDPSGSVVDRFHYKGRRVSSPRSGGHGPGR